MLKRAFYLFSSIKNRFTYYVFKLKFRVQKHGLRIVTLGSKYGGWSFVDDGSLLGVTIISCGLGEDASFDIEFANLYNAKIIIVDPTPRAIKHFKEIINNLGSNKSSEYSHSGTESVNSYDLRSLTKDQMQIVEKAVWKNNSSLNFYLPKDKTHISHSIVNFQNGYSRFSEHIQVEAITIEDLINEFKLSSLPILKLDIEGAETFVVDSLISSKIFPNQILIEYDEMQSLNKVNKKKIYDCHISLLKANYKLVNVQSINFLYVYHEK